VYISYVDIYLSIVLRRSYIVQMFETLFLRWPTFLFLITIKPYRIATLFIMLIQYL